MLADLRSYLANAFVPLYESATMRAEHFSRKVNTTAVREDRSRYARQMSVTVMRPIGGPRRFR